MSLFLFIFIYFDTMKSTPNKIIQFLIKYNYILSSSSDIFRCIFVYTLIKNESRILILNDDKNVMSRTTNHEKFLPDNV